MDIEIVAKISKIDDNIKKSSEEMNILISTHHNLLVSCTGSIEEVDKIKKEIEQKQLYINKLYKIRNKLMKD